MKNLILLACVLVAAVVAVPVPESPKNIELVQIPLEGNKELDILTFAEQDGSINERNKRTIGMLRELFPTLSQILDQKIQMIASYLFRTIGPVILRSGLGGLGGAGSGGSSTSNRNDDFDSDEDEDEDSGKSSSMSSSGRKVSISLPTFPPSTDDDDEDEEDTEAVTIGKLQVSTTEPSTETRIDLLASLNTESDDSASADTNKLDTTTQNDSNLATANDETSLLNSLGAGQDQTIDLIRVVRELKNQEQALAAANGDQETQESQNNEQTADTKSSALDELTLDSVENNDEENRGKRFLSFGGGASAGGSGGSGNFLFDIIRRTADRFARAAGTVYRVVAGTEKLDGNTFSSSSSSTSATATKQNTLHDDDITSRTNNNGHYSLLVSGSSGTEQSDEKANAPDGDGSEHEVAKGDGYTEGIPGPVTRLFVLANRGLSNLIQDLILRIAQTSERVVNFKARLITSLI